MRRNADFSMFLKNSGCDAKPRQIPSCERTDWTSADDGCFGDGFHRDAAEPRFGLLDKFDASFSASHRRSSDFTRNFQPHQQLVKVLVAQVLKFLFQRIE
jgi:hypothetical protein